MPHQHARSSTGSLHVHPFSGRPRNRQISPPPPTPRHTGEGGHRAAMRRRKAKTIGGGAALTFDGPMVVGPDRDARRGGGRGPVPAYHGTARHRRRRHQEPSDTAPAFHPRLGQPVVFVPLAPTSPVPQSPPARARDQKKSLAHPNPCTLSYVGALRHISRTEAE
jgi:hypothetical protein